MLHISDAKSALKVDVAISTEMQNAIDAWALMFQDKAAWLDKNTQSLGLPAAIAGEIVRLTTVELRAKWRAVLERHYLQPIPARECSVLSSPSCEICTAG